MPGSSTTTGATPNAHRSLPKSSLRTPLLLITFTGAASLFIGLKWRAVMARSEAAKREGTTGFGVQTGRSGGGI